MQAICSRTHRLTVFIQFIVERTLEGQGETLKEQVLAAELYGKEADFNTAGDAIVRVDARRLRDKLREYYDAPVIISIPKGSYTPTSDFRPAPTPPLVRGLGLAMAVGLLSVLGVLLLWRVSSGKSD